MSDNTWRDKSDEELAEPLGYSERSQLEAMRRLRKSIEDASESSDRYSGSMLLLTKAIVWLTIILTVLTAVQVFLLVKPLFGAS
jgi:hypothetical protein